MNRLQTAKQVNRLLQKLIQNQKFDDSEAMECAELYPTWNGDSIAYKTGTIVKYGANADGEVQLYRIIQNHTSQPQWTPELTTSLYKKVGFTEEGIPIWTQPLGKEDSYQSGDKVSHKDATWESEADNNVWEPGIYGWKRI